LFKKNSDPVNKHCQYCQQHYIVFKSINQSFCKTVLF